MKRTLLSLVTLVLSSTAFAQAGDDPMPNHVMPLADAVKGVTGAGKLMAKIDVTQGGKPLGTFTCELYEKQTPITVANFVGLARGVRPFRDKSGQWVKKPFYDGLTFHRVIPGFMVQGGDPDGRGTGNPGYKFQDEIVPELKLDKGGLLAMANAGPVTNGSQFFITEVATDYLTGKHTVFGQCDPLDLVKKITGVARGPRDMPAEPVIMSKVTISRGAGKKK